jgi:transposase
VILDNYAIHTSVQTRVFLAEHGDRLRLHFLPPYCPDDNRIERRVWRELHANVTRNHRCGDIEELMEECGVSPHAPQPNRQTNMAQMRVRLFRMQIALFVC